MEQSLFESAMQLNPIERFKLLERIFETLDPPDRQIDEAWNDEAERRLAALKKGDVGISQTASNQQIIRKIKTMALSEQLRLLEQTAALVRNAMDHPTSQRSIMELKGKGKEIWKDVDVQQYLNEERASWA